MNRIYLPLAPRDRHLSITIYNKKHLCWEGVLYWIKCDNVWLSRVLSWKRDVVTIFWYRTPSERCFQHYRWHSLPLFTSQYILLWGLEVLEHESIMVDVWAFPRGMHGYLRTPLSSGGFTFIPIVIYGKKKLEKKTCNTAIIPGTAESCNVDKCSIFYLDVT